MDLIKSGRYIDIVYAKTCATTKISTVTGYHVAHATLLLQLSITYDVKMYLVCSYKFSCSIQVWLWQIVSLADENGS